MGVKREPEWLKAKNTFMGLVERDLHASAGQTAKSEGMSILTLVTDSREKSSLSR
jgi:hypothetical protein